jgi:hypothetical protein
MALDYCCPPPFVPEEPGGAVAEAESGPETPKEGE